MAHFLMVAYYILADILPSLGVESKLLRPLSTMYLTYSDMNGYGHFLPAYFLLQYFWVAIVLLIVLTAYLVHVRGVETRLPQRLQMMRHRFTLPLRLWVFAACAGSLIMGATFYYNTRILNQVHSPSQNEQLKITYEKEYSRGKEHQ